MFNITLCKIPSRPESLVAYAKSALNNLFQIIIAHQAFPNRYTIDLMDYAKAQHAIATKLLLPPTTLHPDTPLIDSQQRGFSDINPDLINWVFPQGNFSRSFSKLLQSQIAFFMKYGAAGALVGLKMLNRTYSDPFELIPDNPELQDKMASSMRQLFIQTNNGATPMISKQQEVVALSPAATGRALLQLAKGLGILSNHSSAIILYNNDQRCNLISIANTCFAGEFNFITIEPPPPSPDAYAHDLKAYEQNLYQNLYGNIRNTRFSCNEIEAFRSKYKLPQPSQVLKLVQTDLVSITENPPADYVRKSAPAPVQPPLSAPRSSPPTQVSSPVPVITPAPVFASSAPVLQPTCPWPTAQISHPMCPIAPDEVPPISVANPPPPGTSFPDPSIPPASSHETTQAQQASDASIPPASSHETTQAQQASDASISIDWANTLLGALGSSVSCGVLLLVHDVARARGYSAEDAKWISQKAMLAWNIAPEIYTRGLHPLVALPTALSLTTSRLSARNSTVAGIAIGMGIGAYTGSSLWQPIAQAALNLFCNYIVSLGVAGFVRWVLKRYLPEKLAELRASQARFLNQLPPGINLRLRTYLTTGFQHELYALEYRCQNNLDPSCYADACRLHQTLLEEVDKRPAGGEIAAHLATQQQQQQQQAARDLETEANRRLEGLHARLRKKNEATLRDLNTTHQQGIASLQDEIRTLQSKLTDAEERKRNQKIVEIEQAKKFDALRQQEINQLRTQLATCQEKLAAQEVAYNQALATHQHQLEQAWKEKASPIVLELGLYRSKKILKKYICTLCMEIKTDFITLSCQGAHAFCRNCIQNHFSANLDPYQKEKGTHKDCPACRAVLNPELELRKQPNPIPQELTDLLSHELIKGDVSTLNGLFTKLK